MSGRFLSVLSLCWFLFFGCGDNLPPTRPVIIGKDSATVADTVLIRIFTIDPEDQVVTYWLEWGDTTTPRWSYFFPSGETIPRTHIYYDVGTYHVRVKARDIDRHESEWSDTFRLRIFPSE